MSHVYFGPDALESLGRLRERDQQRVVSALRHDEPATSPTSNVTVEEDYGPVNYMVRTIPRQRLFIASRGPTKEELEEGFESDAVVVVAIGSMDEVDLDG